MGFDALRVTGREVKSLEAMTIDACACQDFCACKLKLGGTAEYLDWKLTRCRTKAAYVPLRWAKQVKAFQILYRSSNVTRLLILKGLPM